MPTITGSREAKSILPPRTLVESNRARAEVTDASRTHDLPDRLRDPAARARTRGRTARLRVALGRRALAHPDVAQIAVAGRRRAAEDVLRHARSVRGAVR